MGAVQDWIGVTHEQLRGLLLEPSFLEPHPITIRRQFWQAHGPPIRWRRQLYILSIKHTPSTRKLNSGSAPQLPRTASPGTNLITDAQQTDHNTWSLCAGMGH